MVVGVSLGLNATTARYLPLRHDMSDNLDVGDTVEQLWRLLQTGRAVAHNGRFEVRHLANEFRRTLGPDVVGRGYFALAADSMLEAYVLGRYKSKGLKDLAPQVLGIQMSPIESLFPGMKKKASNAIRFNVLGLTPDVIAYACEDASATLGLHQVFGPELEGNPILAIEMAILPILVRMEERGLRLDWDAHERARVAANLVLDTLGTEVRAMFSEALGRSVVGTLNLGSPAQVADVLYDPPPGGLGLKGAGGPGRERSTDAVAVARLAADVPAVRRMMDWRECRKLVTSYLDGYQDAHGWCSCGRVHPSHLQHVVPSGRFACSEVNYQQFPKKYQISSGDHEIKLNFRDLVVAEPGHYLLGFDLSQVELRVLAGVAQEPGLIEAYRNGADVHTQTAAMMFHVTPDEVTPELRAKGKTINFGLQYQLGVKGLADRLNVTVDEAQDLYDKYFAAYPAIRAWVAAVQRQALLDGYVTTRFGRRVVIPELGSRERWMQAKGERLAVNAPIQGGAADYMKIGMIRSERVLREAGYTDRVHLMMNVHDALVYEVSDGIDPQTIVDLVDPEVTFPVPGWPPMAADWSVGPSWGQMKPLGDEPEPPGDDLPEPDYADVDTLADFAAAPAEPVPARVLTVLQGGAVPSPAPLAPASLVVVTLSRMPLRSEWLRFIELCGQGPAAVRVLSPAGRIDIADTGLTRHDASAVSVVFGGAEIHVDAASVDKSAIRDGLKF
jgi:DNA polymerase-1